MVILAIILFHDSVAINLLVSKHTVMYVRITSQERRAGTQVCLVR